jgi:hypothetical protein
MTQIQSAFEGNGVEDRRIPKALTNRVMSPAEKLAKHPYSQRFRARGRR